MLKTGLIWRTEINSSLVLKTWALLMDQHTPTREESSEETGKTTMSWRNNALLKKTALISISGRLTGYHGFRQESCISESSHFLRWLTKAKVFLSKPDENEGWGGWEENVWICPISPVKTGQEIEKFGGSNRLEMISTNIFFTGTGQGGHHWYGADRGQ